MAVSPPDDITLPEHGSTTARTILGQYLRRTLADLFEIPRGRFDATTYDDFSDVRAQLQRLLRDKKSGPVFSLLRRPTCSVLVRCLHQELWGQGDVTKLDAWLTELNALCAIELALADQLPPGGLRLRRHPKRICVPALGFELCIEAGGTLGFLPGKLIFEGSTGRQEVLLEQLTAGDPGELAPGLSLSRPYHGVVGGVRFALADNNPLALEEAHPEKSGNEISLGDKSIDEWVSSLQAGHSLVREHLPDLAAELELVMQLWHPVGYDDHRHLSASYAEAIGAAYVSLHPDPMTMAEALIHEFSHNKINALFALDRVLENAHAPLFTSPIRPDPRPLYGIMLAVHAFVPVARLYEVMLEQEHPLSKRPGFERRYSEIVAKNHDGISTLEEHAKTTPVGRAVLDELLRWDQHFVTQTA